MDYDPANKEVEKKTLQEPEYLSPDGGERRTYLVLARSFVEVYLIAIFLGYGRVEFGEFLRLQIFCRKELDCAALRLGIGCIDCEKQR